MGAPLNNTNAQTRGLVTSRRAAAAGVRTRRLPKGYRYVASEAHAYATGLSDAVEAAHGEVGRNHLETIEAASAWHMHSLYTLRVLRVDHDKLEAEARVRLSGEVAKSVQKRVDLVKQLGLPDRVLDDPFDGNLPDDGMEGNSDQ